MNKYMRKEPERSYTWNGWKPYGAGDLVAMDARVEQDFSGNVVEQLLSEGYKMTDGRLIAPDGVEIACFERA